MQPHHQRYPLSFQLTIPQDNALQLHLFRANQSLDEFIIDLLQQVDKGKVVPSFDLGNDLFNDLIGDNFTVGYSARKNDPNEPFLANILEAEPDTVTLETALSEADYYYLKGLCPVYGKSESEMLVELIIKYLTQLGSYQA